MWSYRAPNTFNGSFRDAKLFFVGIHGLVSDLNYIFCMASPSWGQALTILIHEIFAADPFPFLHRKKWPEKELLLYCFTPSKFILAREESNGERERRERRGHKRAKKSCQNFWQSFHAPENWRKLDKPYFEKEAYLALPYLWQKSFS